jgi:predicted transcriptional regulator
MKRTRLHDLGETEMEVLQHVWELSRASVGDVHERILVSRKVAYNTVMTVMKNLAEKGYLSFEREGNQYVYSAARPEDEVKHSLVQGLMDKVFGGSPYELVQTLVRHEKLTPDQQREIRRIIESMEDDNDGD